MNSSTLIRLIPFSVKPTILDSLCLKVVNGKQEQSSCSRYKLDVVRNFSAQGLVPGRDVNLTELEQESCVDGWTYSKDIYQSTIVSEVCTHCGNGCGCVAK